MEETGQWAMTFLSLCGGNYNSCLFFLSLHVSLPSFLKISGPLFLFTHPHPSSTSPIYPASPPNPLFFVTSFRREVVREIQQRGLSTDKELGKEFMSLFSVNCLMCCGPELLLKEKAMRYQRMRKEARESGDLYLLKMVSWTWSFPLVGNLKRYQYLCGIYTAGTHPDNSTSLRQPRIIKTLV